MKKSVAVGLSFASLFAAGSAWATPGDLADPPGVYYGTGNSNGDFTIDTEGSVEVGLRAIVRYTGAIAPSGNVYNAPLGDTTVAGQSGPAWGLDYSVNLNVDDTSSLHISDIVANLTMQDIAKGTSGTYDISTIFDNYDYNGGSVCQGYFALTPPFFFPCDATQYFAFQNSEPVAEGLIGTLFNDPLIDDSIDDTYIFTLNLSTLAGAPLASDQIIVNAGTGAPAGVPEPITLSIFGVGVAGMAAIKRRRKAKA